MAIKYKNYKIIETEKELDKLIKYCKQTGYASVDFETSGHEWHSPLGYPTILGVSFQPGSAWIIPLGHFDSPFKKNWEKILKRFGKEVIENTSIIKIAQNIKFEMKWFSKYGITMKGILFDNMLAKYLLDEEKPMGLKPMVDKFIPKYFGYSEDYEGSKKPWDQKPLNGLSQYCALDCDNTFKLMMFFENQLIKNNLYSLFRNLMMMGARVLDESERGGMPVDAEYLDALMTKYEILIEETDTKLRQNPFIKKVERKLNKDRINKHINKIQGEIDELKVEKKKAKKSWKKYGDSKDLTIYNRKSKAIQDRLDKIDRLEAGELITAAEKKLIQPINFSSPAQMIELLYTKKGFNFKVIRYTVDKKTKQETKTPSTDEATLLELKKNDKTGFLDGLLEYRGLTKLYSTYVKGIKEKLSVDNKVHGRFLLEGTVTGRLCISQDCLLHTNKGLVRIGDIIPYDEGGIEIIDGYEVLTHTGEYKPITHVINKGKEMMYEVELDNGKKITCTENHIFLTNKGWKKLKDIKDEEIISWEDN